jgi:hypothetical protein
MSLFADGFVDIVAVVAVVSYAVCFCRCLSSNEAAVVAVAAHSAVVVMALVAVVAGSRCSSYLSKSGDRCCQ